MVSIFSTLIPIIVLELVALSKVYPIMCVVQIETFYHHQQHYTADFPILSEVGKLSKNSPYSSDWDPEDNECMVIGQVLSQYYSERVKIVILFISLYDIYRLLFLVLCTLRGTFPFIHSHLGRMNPY